MIARPKERIPDYPDLTPHETYFVIGIEADDLRILNETAGKMPVPPEKPHGIYAARYGPFAPRLSPGNPDPDCLADDGDDSFV